MAIKTKHENIILHPEDNSRLANLCGQLDENLRQIESHMDVEISNRGNTFRIKGNEKNVPLTLALIKELYKISEFEELTPKHLHMYMNNNKSLKEKNKNELDSETLLKLKKITIRPKSKTQESYIKGICKSDLSFGIGPAGTGKTYLAVACAVNYLENNLVKKIFLARPAVEAGEKLGFLPGDLAEKVDPYLQPIYDALYEVVGYERITRLLEKKIIEIVPLAYMRGRTLNDAFIILDEAQNTTIAQMKMFLTRIGYGSKTVVTGDISQVDLPKDTKPGLKDCLEFISKVKGTHVSIFKSGDVMRHSIVKSIIREYDKRESE